MKFNTFVVSLLATATTVLGYCGHQCDPKRVPTTPLTGDIEIVSVVDNKNPSIKYQIGGKITIINDCTFKVENFYMFPGVNVAKWMGAPVDSTEGISLTKDYSVMAVDPNQPMTQEYNVDEADPFCKASLLDNVGEFRLVDNTYQLLARAKVNPVITSQSSDKANSNSSSTSNNNSKTDNDNDTSDAKTSKWSMALLGLTGLAGYLLA